MTTHSHHTQHSHWRDRPVLVTGATGFLGSWLVDALTRSGASVTALVRDRVPKSMLLTSDSMSTVNFVYGDVRDQRVLERAIGEYEVDTVFHLAAQSTVGVANRNAVSTFDTNVRGTWALLEAVRRSPLVRSVVIASSDKAYGEQEELPYTESSPLLGVNPYDASKACADMIARSYALTFGVPVAITRCGNFFGGGDLNWNRIVPGIIRAALRGNRPVLRSDGTMVRDYFYVEDAAGAYLCLAEQLHGRPELRGEAFNFSNELQRDVLTFAQTIMQRLGSTLELDIRADAPHEIQHQWLSAAKARRVLGWSSAFTLDEGLDRTIAWYRNHLARG
ncbi:MAG: GDP-mannose 4,6-dehydratase [Gemmatimonadetes bacterium]|nr:GDP-mannose 4,6-dehydratase [Gemmatimonadota bacterium]